MIIGLLTAFIRLSETLLLLSLAVVRYVFRRTTNKLFGNQMKSAKVLMADSDGAIAYLSG